MQTMSFEPRTELRPVRACPTCRRIWPADWEYCQNCAVWLPGHDTVERITNVKEGRSAGGLARHKAEASFPPARHSVGAIRCNQGLPAQILGRLVQVELQTGSFTKPQWRGNVWGLHEAVTHNDAIDALPHPFEIDTPRSGNPLLLQTVSVKHRGTEQPQGKKGSAFFVGAQSRT